MKIGLQLLEYLHEIEFQMIYAELGYDSMWSFCLGYLGLSEGDAQRKLATMRLCKTIPEVKTNIIQGKLTMTNAAQVQSFFNAEKRAGNDLPIEKKKEVLQSIQHLSKTQCERKLMELSPVSAIPKERLRQTLKRVKKAKGLASAPGTPVKKEPVAESVEESAEESVEVEVPLPPVIATSSNRQAIPAGIRREIFRRANGKCEYRSVDGRRCASQAPCSL